MSKGTIKSAVKSVRDLLRDEDDASSVNVAKSHFVYEKLEISTNRNKFRCGFDSLSPYLENFRLSRLN